MHMFKSPELKPYTIGSLYVAKANGAMLITLWYVVEKGG